MGFQEHVLSFSEIKLLVFAMFFFPLLIRSHTYIFRTF
jgi:hypothetical protein